MATRPDGQPARGLSDEQLIAGVRRVTGALGPGGGAAAAALETGAFRGQSWVRLPPEDAFATLAALRDDEEISFEMLTDLTCVHFPRRPLPLGDFDVVYQLSSLSRGHRLRLKVACPDAEAGVDSVVSLWPGASFLEREAYDMFGVRFRGHPDLRRILMPEGYVGWPLRKDFPYRGY
jgi:NADH-quinone oxidoreductase subunit C